MRIALVDTMSKKISVLIPTLGMREIELKRLFESLMNQKYDNLEVVVVVQDNHDAAKRICDLYSNELDIIFVQTNKKGLSQARNLGLINSTGEIILLSDDDCWYENNAMKYISDFFAANSEIDILLTQIYDPITKSPYKEYPKEAAVLKKAMELLSKSSVEIAFKGKEINLKFDEAFGLGAKYTAGEENDFLICALKKGKKIQYKPVVTVFHEKKIYKEDNKQLIAKGALYAKHFGFFISNAVLLRDLIIKHQNNYRWFWNGYFEYKRQN